MSTHTHTPSQLDRLLAAPLAGLLHYSESDPVFAESFAALIQANVGNTTDATRYEAAPITHPWQCPRTQTDATRHALWLLGEVTNSSTSTPATTQLLHSFANTYESPKDQIFGIVGIAIIGPTLGLIQKKKKKKSQLAIVTEVSWFSAQSPAELSRVVQSLSTGLTATELRNARGYARRLHPDTADWLYTERTLGLFTAAHETLKALQQEAKVAKLPHLSHQTEDERTVALALSPQLAPEHLSAYELTRV